MRSIIQSAGRVRRHRPAVGDHPNVLILGRSPIAMQSGKLSRPGVETEPADETMVARVSLLECFEDRLLRDLAGDETISHITAKTMISGEGNVPLRDAEACLRKRMISTDEAQPLGKYLLHLNARLNLTMTRSRKFRRSITRDILYLKIGDDLKDAEWYLDLAPGTRESALSLATDNNLHLLESDGMGEPLFRKPIGLAWEEYAAGRQEISLTDLKTLMQVEIPDFGNELAPSMTYSEFSGFTRGKPEDLFGPFGKAV